MKKIFTASLTAALVFGMGAETFAEYDAERHSIGKFQWSASLKADFVHRRPQYSYSHKYHIYLTPKYKFDEHLSLNGNVEFYGDYKKMRNEDPEFYLSGDYAPWGFNVGLVPLYTNEGGMIFDTVMLGGAVSWGKDFGVRLYGGKIKDEEIISRPSGEFSEDDANTTLVGLNLQYDTKKTGLYGGAGFYYLWDDQFRNEIYNSNGTIGAAEIWSVNAGYRFSKKFNVFATYAANEKAAPQEYIWKGQVSYGKCGSYPNRGDWMVYAGYTRYGTNLSYQGKDDDVTPGSRGFNCGLKYAPFRNVSLAVKYSKGELINSKKHTEKISGVVQIYF